VAVPKSHPLADLAEFPLAALAGERLLVREASSRTRMAIEALLLDASIVPAEMMELHTRETIREGVAIGLGFSLFFSLECPPDSRIRFLPLDVDASTSRLTGYIVCLSERRRTKLLNAVIDAAAELKEMSPLPVHPISAVQPSYPELKAPERMLEAAP
jgi:LysR family transcriptional regulator, low CO2-responsive transcriptional regulator